MKFKAVSGITLTLLLIGMLALAFNIQLVKASGTIYIRADGSVEGTDKIQRDGDVYTFTDNIYDEIVVERDNIVVDGAGYTVQGTGTETGIDLSNRNNVTLKNVEVTNFQYGIYLRYSSNNVLSGNTATSNNIAGIHISYSSNNTLSGNTATSNNIAGILLYASSNNVLASNNASHNQYNFGVYGFDFSEFNNDVYTSNTVDGKPIYYLIDEANVIIDAKTNAGTIYLINSNNITIKDLTLTKNWYGAFFWNTTNSKIEDVTASNNLYGIGLNSSSNNVLFHNNFIDNTNQVHSENSINTWDDGYPSGGNYWSDHSCTGNPSDGSQRYVIDANNVDQYPFQDSIGPPTILVLSPQNTTYTKNSVPLTFTVSKLASWMGYSLDSQPDVTITGNTTLLGLSEGTHNIIIYANDTSNNMGSSSKVYFTIDTTASCVPSLISPEEGAVLDNGRTDTLDDIVWDFNWSDCEGASQYHLYVIGPTATIPVIDDFVNESSYHSVSSGSYISDVNRFNWTWKVRAQIDDQWGEWSETRTFDVEPVNSDPPAASDTIPPVADAGLDQTVNKDTLLTFDGSGSWDNVGIVDYTWAFTDMTPQTLTGVNPTYNFTTPGVYVITLNVTDAAGNWNTDEVVITVLDVTAGALELSVGNYIEYEYNFTGTYVGEMEGTARAEVTKVDGNNYTVRVDYSPTDGSDAWTETDSYLLGEDFMCPLTMMWQAEYVADETVQTKVGTVSAARYTTGIDDAIYVHKESKILVLRTLNGQTVMEITDTDIEWLIDTTSPDIIDVSQFPFKNNVLPEDEVQVNATVTDYVSGVKQVTLNYTNGNGIWITVDMTNLEGNVWNATIPSFPYGTNVTYVILAEDNSGNTVTSEELGYEYQYQVVPEFPSFLILPLFMIATLLAVMTYRRK